MSGGDAKTVSLAEALRHGAAVHQHGYPWRIRAGQPEVGVPRVNDDGQPRQGKNGLILDWETITPDEAFERWSLEGWILR